MKSFITFVLCLFSLQLLACPNLTGTYKDEDDNLISITQINCEQTVWSDADSSKTLLADNIERVIQEEGKMKAFGKASFTTTDFVLDIRVDYGTPVPSNIPTHFLTSYHIDKFNNMIERAESSQGLETIIYRRVK